MNAVTRWKVVLALIAIFVAVATTGGFLTSRAVKDAMHRVEQPHQLSILRMDRLRDLRLKPEQADKVRSILRQMDTELSNLRGIDLP
jgi:hypothetical protein